MEKNGLMKSKTHCKKYFRFGRFLPELRRGHPAGNLASAGCSFYFYFLSSSETFSNGNNTICLKVEKKFQVLTVKFWGLVWERIFWSFFYFSQLVLIYKRKKRPFIIGCSETQGANAPSPGAHFSWLAEPPLKYEVVSSRVFSNVSTISSFCILPNWKRKWEPHKI